MRIGINGIGSIGRLALRAAMGGIYRPDDPRGRTGSMSCISTSSRAVLPQRRISSNSTASTALARELRR